MKLVSGFQHWTGSIFTTYIYSFRVLSPVWEGERENVLSTPLPVTYVTYYFNLNILFMIVKHVQNAGVDFTTHNRITLAGRTLYGYFSYV